MIDVFSTKQKSRYAAPPVRVRKPRIDKKMDIKIPLTEDIYDRIAHYADRQRVSMTFLATTYMEQIVARNHDFKEVDYEDSELTVHVKANQDLIDTINRYKSKWRYRSTRKTAHRLFMEVIRKGLLG